MSKRAILAARVPTSTRRQLSAIPSVTRWRTHPVRQWTSWSMWWRLSAWWLPRCWSADHSNITEIKNRPASAGRFFLRAIAWRYRTAWGTLRQRAAACQLWPPLCCFLFWSPGHTAREHAASSAWL